MYIGCEPSLQDWTVMFDEVAKGAGALLVSAAMEHAARHLGSVHEVDIRGRFFVEAKIH